MALPLLIFLLLPVHNHALKIICDPAEGGEWTSECDFKQVNGQLTEEEEEDDEMELFGFMGDNSNKTRNQRAVDDLPGLRVPARSQCPEDLMLSRMVSRVLSTYFEGCVPVLRYDRYLENSCGVQKLLSGELSQGYTHGRLSGSINSIGQSPVPRDGSCAVLVFLMQHVEDARAVSRTGTSRDSALLIVTASPLWRVDEFMDKWEGRPWKMLVLASAHRKRPVISTKFLIPWFPNSLNVAVRHEPPYSIHRPNETGSEWTGIEKVVFELLSYKLNFTYSIKFMPEYDGILPLKEAVAGTNAEVGIGGAYFGTETPDLATTIPYTHDCAVFMTRASTALPKHRAILGPFQLSVWLTLTTVYIALSLASAVSPQGQKTKKKPPASQTRLDSFWLVFGTFTNAFSVKGRVWSERMSIRILLTCYWIFTIIITAAYTSSIIAFVTLPVFPTTVDTAEEILSTPEFRWGTLGSAGWTKWLQDTDDSVSRHIQAGFEWLPRVEDGVRNVSRSGTYAFLGAKNRLQYESSDDLGGILSGKKALHLGTQCFLPLLPAFLTTPALRPAMDPWLLLFSQNGFIVKAQRDIAFQEERRRLKSTAKGGMRVEYTRKLPHERKLSLEDVVGTFFVLLSGVLLGFTSLAFERIIHWFKVNQIAQRIKSSMAKARRKVSALSGSNSGGSSLQSLRLRSGRIWSKGGRGSRLGSMLEMVPEPPDSPSEEHRTHQEEAVDHHHHPVQDVLPLPDSQIMTTSLPHLERQPTREEEEDEHDELTEVKSLRRPLSSCK